MRNVQKNYKIQMQWACTKDKKNHRIEKVMFGKISKIKKGDNHNGKRKGGIAME